MTQPLINKRELLREVAQALDRPCAQVESIANAIFDQIKTHVAERRAVNIAGFGKFCLRKLGRRQGRDPATGKTTTFRPCVLPLFRPSDSFKLQVRDAAA